MIQFTYCGQCLPNLKNMSRVGCLIFLPEQMACVVFSFKTCIVMASEMSDIAHVMLYVSKRCITSANVATDSWTASTSSPSLSLTSRHSSSISCSMLKRKLPPYSLNDTTVFNSVITAHSSALITSTCCAAQF